MKPLIAFGCSLLSVSTFSQTPFIDSLKKVVASSAPARQRLQSSVAICEQLFTKDFDATITYASGGIQLARSLGDSVNVAVCKRYLGMANYFHGKFDIAATHYYEAIALLEKTSETKQLALAYNDLAKLHRKTGDYVSSLGNYDKAMAIFEQSKDSSGMAMIWNESGVVFEYQKNYKEAISRYSRSLQMARLLNDRLGESYALNFIAGVQTIQHDYAAAEQNLLACIDIRKSIKDTFSLALAQTDLGTTYIAAGQYNKAIELLLQSNQYADLSHYPDLKLNNFIQLAAAEKSKGNFSQALEYQEQGGALKDSLFNIAKAGQINELEAKYQGAKKDQEIALQKFEIARKNYWLIGSGVLLLLGVLLGYSYYRRFRLKKEKQLQAEIIRQQDLSTKAILQAEENERERIARELHDGVGQMMSAAKMNLSAMEDDLKLEDGKQKTAYDRIVNLVDESCKEVRAVSHQMMPNALLKKGLTSAIREFVDNIDSRILKVDLYSEGLNERIDSNTETVLYRVVQECVNNVIKHSGANHLDISLIKDPDGISVTIEDNGKGFLVSEKEKSEGIGLKNIRTRVEFLKGTVDFDSTPGKGTLVAIHVPVGD
ncbi:MAG: sensor histidine kinase [Bacteroidota bacterium]